MLLFLSVFLSISLASRARRPRPSQDNTAQGAVPKAQELELRATAGSSDIGSFDTSWSQLSEGHLIVTVDKVVYMLSDAKTVKWVTDIPDMNGSPIVTPAGQIYGIAADNKQFSIDGASGKVRFFKSQVVGSHSSYTQIKAYKTDEFLIVENMQFYRDGNLCYPKCPMTNDQLFAWQGEKFLWSTEFPPNAELQVFGDRILAVSKKMNSVVIREIELPKSKQNGRHQ